ncbi:cyclopropane-fatty-acyl-phospholipid synthase family protein [Phenylobacterium sp.]|uniref:SAM-dependent methyltransferase n=1 Tax=Phenylobacterium sp. TaxID=1871053 RepID=UPI00356711D1
MGEARDTLKLMIGRVAELALPQLGREIDEIRNTARAAKLKRAILYARLRRAQSRGDVVAVEKALGKFWRGEGGDRFHNHYAHERRNLFRELHSGVIDTLARLLEESGGRFPRLVEIGCGDGSTLAYCAQRLPSIAEAVGLDINAAVIARISAEPPAGGRIRFAEADAREWLAANPRPGTVALTNGGVLEYFSQANFDALLRVLARSPPAALVLIEPVAPDHDLQSQTTSFVFGHERSFSHNHRSRLTEAGFEVVFAEEIPTPEVRWMLMIGVIS